MLSNRSFYFSVALSTSIFALSAGGALAQTTAAIVDEVVVTGYRAQNTQAITAKEEAVQIADFLTTDVMGQLPDYNISDSFRRLPGVQTIFDEDEGRYVAIRGLNPNFTSGTFDGGGIATAERQNRQLNLESVPTTAVKRLEVFKSRTPDLDGNAIGGSINLVTRSAFDNKGFFAVGEAFIGVNDSQAVPGKGYNRTSDDGPNMRIDGTASWVLGPDDQFGVLLTGAFSRKRRDQERQLPQAFLATPGTFGVPISRLFRTSSYPNSVDRYGGTLKLEWKPTDTLHTTLAATYYMQADNELRFNHELQLPAIPATPGAAYTQNATGGLNVSGAAGYTLFNDFPIKKPLTIVQGSFAWEPAENQTLSGRASYSEAQFLEASNETRFSFANSTTNAGAYFNSEGIPNYVFANPGAATFNTPSAYRFTSYLPYRDDSDDYIYEAQVDYGFNTGKGATGWGFAAGGKYRANTRDFDTGQVVANPSATNTLTLDRALQPTTYRSPYAPGNQLIIDFEKFLDYFYANPGQFTIDGAATALNRARNDFVVEEKILSTYGLARYADDANTVIFGLRYERTDTDIDGARVTGSVVTPLQRSGDYDNLLPSINYIRSINDDLKIRAAYYKAVGRPSPSELGANEQVSTANSTVSRGNPDLKPRFADNFDVAIEYYLPGGGGILSAGVFYKKIKNDIFSAQTGTTVINGQTFTVTQPQNLTESEVKGLELQVVKNRLDFLPGFLSNFGASANATLIDAESQLPGGKSFDRLQFQAKKLANFAIFYEQGPFKARATYAYTGDYFTVISATNVNDNRYDRPYNQVDLQARWDWGAFETIAEVRNLTNEKRINYQNGGLARDLNIFGRQLWLGVAFKPW
jgi:TonB-dependent receptor